MNKGIINYVIMFIVLVLTQVLFLNQVQFCGFVNPYVYVLFIMLLPLSAPRYVVLLSAFIIGISVDIFSNTLGLHAFASVLVAFLRPALVGAITNRETDMEDYPGIKQNGLLWFVYYASLMVFVHHLAFFYLEVFSFSNFFGTLLRVFVSSIASIFVIVLSQYIVFRD